MNDEQGWAIETANPFSPGNQSGKAARNGERPTQPPTEAKTNRVVDRLDVGALYQIRAPHLLADRSHDGDAGAALPQSSLHRGDVARPVYAAALDQTAVHPRRHHAGAPSRCRDPGGDAATL